MMNKRLKWLVGGLTIASTINVLAVAYLVLDSSRHLVDGEKGQVRHDRTAPMGRTDETLNTLNLIRQMQSAHSDGSREQSEASRELNVEESESQPTERQGVGDLDAPRSRSIEVPLDSEVADVFMSEPRDRNWASRVEQRFNEKAQENSNRVSVERVYCGSRRCAVKATTVGRGPLQEIPAWFGDGIVRFDAKPTQGGYSYQAIYMRDGDESSGR